MSTAGATHPAFAPTDAQAALLAFAPDALTLRPARALQTIAAWYRSVRARGVDLDEDGDMLLAEWGPVHLVGEAPRWELGLVRQLLWDGDDGEQVIWQLRLAWDTSMTPAIRSGQHWCTAPDDLDGWLADVQAGVPLAQLGDVLGPMRLELEQV